MLHLEGIRADAELQPRTTRDGRSQRGGQLEQQSVPEHLRQQQLMREDSAAHRNDGEDGNSSAGCKLQQSEDEHFALLGEAGTDRGNYGSFDDSDRFLQRSGSFMDLESDGFVGGRQLARKLYGMSDKEYKAHQYEKEQETRQSRSQLAFWKFKTVHPYDRRKLLWDIFIAVLVGYTAVTVPFEITFITSRTASLVLFSMGVLVDIVFCVDIFVSSITGYWTPNDELIMEPRRTAKNYMRTFLLLDVLSVLPIDYFALVEGEKGFINPSRSMLVLRMMRLLRLLRLTKILRYTKKYFAHVSPLRVHISLLGMAIFFFIHTDACLLFLISRLSGFPDDSWVVLSGIDTHDVGQQYIWSLYTSISIMLCISYGSYTPTRTLEALFITLSNLVGASIYAVVIATLTTLIMNANKSGTEFRQYMDEMNLFMKDYKLPKGLRKRIRGYIRKKFPYSRKFDEESLLESLPRSLYRDVHVNRLKLLTQKVPLFSNASEGFLQSFIPELDTELVLAGDLAVIQDEPVSGLYIIGSGELEVIRDGVPIMTLADGSFFGDVAVLWNTREPFTVRAVTDSTLHIIPEHRFYRLREYFADMGDVMRKVSSQRLSRIGMGEILEERRGDAAFKESSSMLNLDSIYSKVRQHASRASRVSGDHDSARGSRISGDSLFQEGKSPV